MTVTKAAGAVLGAFLIFLLSKWAAEALFHVGGHGEPAYVIDTGASDEPEEAADEPDLGALLAAADIDKGEKLFKKCAACHKLEDGANSTGPHLYGVVGRAVGSVDGFGYSDVLAGMGGDWTAEDLDAFLKKPSDYAPGTKMSFAGLPKAGDRADLIAFLNTQSSAPVEFSAAEAPAEETPAAEAPAEEAPAATDTVEAPAGDAPTVEAPAPTNAPADVIVVDEPATTDTPADSAATETPAAETPAEETPAADAPAEETPAATETAAVAGDPEAGENVFKKCKACHKMEDGKNGVGPHLFGVIGRPVASVDGFKYSSALQEVGGEWTVERLHEFLTKPSDFAKGTKMTFAGLKDQTDRDDVIAYMNSVGN